MITSLTHISISKTYYEQDDTVVFFMFSYLSDQRTQHHLKRAKYLWSVEIYGLFFILSKEEAWKHLL